MSLVGHCSVSIPFSFVYICLSSGICPCLCLNIFYIFFIPVCISFCPISISDYILSPLLLCSCQIPVSLSAAILSYSILYCLISALIMFLYSCPYSCLFFRHSRRYSCLSFVFVYVSLLPYSVLFCFYSLSIHATAFCPFNLFLMGVRRSSVGVRRSSLGVRCSSVVSTLDC